MSRRESPARPGLACRIGREGPPSQVGRPWPGSVALTATGAIRTEALLHATDLRAALSCFTRRLKIRLDMIHPADDPFVAALSGHGRRVRLIRRDVAPGVLTDDTGFAAEGRMPVSPEARRSQLASGTRRWRCLGRNKPPWRGGAPFRCLG